MKWKDLILGTSGPIDGRVGILQALIEVAIAFGGAVASSVVCAKLSAKYNPSPETDYKEIPEEEVNDDKEE